MQITLNIYDGKNVTKTYTASEYDVTFGTVEDLVNLIDTDKLKGDVSDIDFVSAVAVVLKGGIGQVKSLLHDLFPDVTDEELKHTKMKEVLQLVVNVMKYGFSEMMEIGSKN